MTIEQTLHARSDSQCELCGNNNSLLVYPVSGNDTAIEADRSCLICSECQQQIDGQQQLDENHWRCLNDSMWSVTPAVQVLAYRQLKALNHTDWAPDLLEMLYLEPEMLSWAEQGLTADQENSVICKDSNGTVLNSGDSVTLIKDLVVKGANFTAKRGTLVKNISLTDNPDQVEGKVQGVRIVLLSQFLKKA